MKNYIIAIGLRAPRAVVDRLLDRIEALVVEVTQGGEVEALTTELVEGSEMATAEARHELEQHEEERRGHFTASDGTEHP